MANFSPKIEIINHFDRLINRVDIDIEQCLENYNDKQVLGDLESFETYTRHVKFVRHFNIQMSNSYQSSDSQQKDNFWSKSTKVVDYLHQVRMKTIEKLRKAQEDALEYLKSNSSIFNSLNQQTDTNELICQLFGEKFYFQVFYDQSKHKSWIFNLFTFVTDFYMSPFDIDILEKMVNDEENNYRTWFDDQDAVILDEKMILIGLCQKYFLKNLKKEQYPHHMICVSKQDILNIDKIEFSHKVSRVNLTSSSSIDLSNLQILTINGKSQLEEIKLEGLSSLYYVTVNVNSLERASFKNLISLKDMTLLLTTPINSEIQAELFHDLQNTQYFSLDYLDVVDRFRLELENFKDLLLSEMLNEYFPSDLYKNLSNHITELHIDFSNLDDQNVTKLFDGHLRFPHITKLAIMRSKITKLEKKLFNGFPSLIKLFIFENKELRTIEYDAFSDLKQLECLNLSNNSIESLDKRHFSQLTHLEYLDLRVNRLESIEENTFSNLVNLETLCLSENRVKELNHKSFAGLRNLKGLYLRDNKFTYFDIRILDNMDRIETINLSGNRLINKEEILNRFKDSKINFIF